MEILCQSLARNHSIVEQTLLLELLLWTLNVAGLYHEALFLVPRFAMTNYPLSYTWYNNVTFKLWLAIDINAKLLFSIFHKNYVF